MEGNMADMLYNRLGGYDAIAAVADDLLPRLMADAQLGRFWQNRAEDSLRRKKQPLLDFLCASSGGPLYYVGGDMETSRRGMGISESDWQAFLVHLEAIHEGKAFEMNWRGADGDRIRTVICIRRVSGRNLKWSKFCDLGRVTARVRETEEKFPGAGTMRPSSLWQRKSAAFPPSSANGARPRRVGERACRRTAALELEPNRYYPRRRLGRPDTPIGRRRCSKS